MSIPDTALQGHYIQTYWNVYISLMLKQNSQIVFPARCGTTLKSCFSYQIRECFRIPTTTMALHSVSQSCLHYINSTGGNKVQTCPHCLKGLYTIGPQNPPNVSILYKCRYNAMKLINENIFQKVVAFFEISPKFRSEYVHAGSIIPNGNTHGLRILHFLG